MCEFLKVGISNEQRNAYSAMFARIVLHRMGQNLKDSKDKDKDWALPKCCSIYGSDKKLVEFDDFLQNIYEPENYQVGDENDVLEIKTKLKELSETILNDESTGIPTPLLESIQIMTNVFTTTEKPPERDRLAKALTRTFYLSGTESYAKIEVDKDIALLRNFFNRQTSIDLYFSGYFCVDYFLTLLTKQGICPHLPQFSAFLACLEKCSDTKELPEDKNNLRFVHMYEFPMKSVDAWITEPDDEDAKNKFQLKRPTLLEVENVLFQMCNTIYCLNAFTLDFDSKFVADENFLSNWRCFTCQKITGYDRYKILDQVFYVPNYGNFIVFHPDYPTRSNSTCLDFNFEGGDISDDQILNPIKKIIATLIDRVNRWTEPKSYTRYPFEFNVNYEQEQKIDMEPTKLIVFQKNEILQYLGKFQKQIADMNMAREFNNTGYEIYGRILNQMFPSYKKVSSHNDQDVSDLTLMNDYGFHLQTKGKLKVTRFISEILFKYYWDQTLPGLWNPTKLMEPQKNGEPQIVNPDVLSIAATLEASVGKPRNSQLLAHLRTRLGEFLEESGLKDYGTAISDRYMVDASQLALRKSLRRYGISFLTLMNTLDEKSSNQDWWNLSRLRDVFTDASAYVSKKDPIVQAALRNVLKANQPSDLNRFLSTLMFLTYLQGFNPKKVEEKVEEKTGPTMDELKDKFIQEFAALMGISTKDLKTDLEIIESQFTLPIDVKSELTYLMEKLTRIMSKSRGQAQLKPSHDSFIESEKQRSALDLIKKAGLKFNQNSKPLEPEEKEKEDKNETPVMKDYKKIKQRFERAKKSSESKEDKILLYDSDIEDLDNLLRVATNDEEFVLIGELAREIQTARNALNPVLPEAEATFFPQKRNLSLQQLENKIQEMQRQLQSLLIQQKQMKN